MPSLPVVRWKHNNNCSRQCWGGWSRHSD